MERVFSYMGNNIKKNITKKNILMIIPTLNYSGGIESFVMNNIRYVSSEEFTIDIITHDLHADDYVAEIDKIGGRVFLFPKFLPQNFKEIKQLYLEILRKKKYDIVHCHMANAAFFYLKYAQKSQVPVRILHSHQNKAADTLSHVIRNIPLLKLGKRYANFYMACSQVAGDFLFSNSTYDIIRNAIDYEKYKYDSSIRDKIRNQYNFSSSDIIIGHTGRLTAQKNQKFLIELVNELYQINRNYKLVLVGSGEDLEELQNLVENLHLKESVFFLGDRNDVESLLQMFDIFVFPSLYEGLGISVLEAQASGLFCICSTGIPSDADISENILHISLKENMQTWVDNIIDKKSNDRSDVILDTKYSIKSNASLLFELYIKYLKTCKK